MSSTSTSMLSVAGLTLSTALSSLTLLSWSPSSYAQGAPQPATSHFKEQLKVARLDRKLSPSSYARRAAPQPATSHFKEQLKVAQLDHKLSSSNYARRAAPQPATSHFKEQLKVARLDRKLSSSSYARRAAPQPATSHFKEQLKVAQLDRKRPGADPKLPYQRPAQTDPNENTALPRVQPPPPRVAPDDYVPIPDRWRLINDLGLIEERWHDPYNRNILKADRPFYDDWFFNLSVISDTILEPRSIPTPVGLQGSNQADDLGIFGDQQQLTFNQNLILGFIVFKGDTVFRPPDYEFRFTPVINYNYTKVREVGVLNVDPREGDDRHDAHLGVQELFLDYHIRNVSDRYDFDSVRIGIQPFSSDFRGFLFQDNQLGIRLFGNRDNNLWQYNLAWFRKLEKDTNSGLNDLAEEVRQDDTFIFNLYRQDWPVLGFTTMGTVIHNRNGEDEFFFDKNGFIQRPASLGNERLRRYRVNYLGLHGDGHFGRLNLTFGAYYAFGNESAGVFTVRPQEIRAYFGAAEASVDFDWIRARVHAVHASADDDPFDSRAEGFDAIFENPIIAGADTSFTGSARASPTSAAAVSPLRPATACSTI